MKEMRHILQRARKISADDQRKLAALCLELVRNPQNSEVLPSFARFLISAGYLRDAHAALERAAIVDNQNLDVLERSIFVLEILGQIEKAERAQASLLQKLKRTRRAPELICQLARFHLLRGAEESGWHLLHRAAVLDGLTDGAIDRAASEAQNVRVQVVCGDDFARIIHHARWFRPFAKRFDTIFTVDRRLLSALSRSFPDLHFAESTDDTEAIKVNFTSVPHLAGPDVDPEKHWLRSDLERTARWRAWLEEQGPEQLFIGITWRSTLRGTYNFTPDPRHALTDLKRNLKSSLIDYPHMWRKQVPLGAFRRLFGDKMCQAVSIQHGFGPVEANFLKKKNAPLIIPDIDFFGDLEEVISLIDALDGLISIPSTHAHMAAALGKPVVVLEHERPSQFWGIMRHRRHYAAVASVLKPIELFEWGQFRIGVYGDWGPTVDLAFDLIRDRLLKSERS